MAYSYDTKIGVFRKNSSMHRGKKTTFPNKPPANANSLKSTYTASQLNTSSASQTTNGPSFCLLLFLGQLLSTLTWSSTSQAWPQSYSPSSEVNVWRGWTASPLFHQLQHGSPRNIKTPKATLSKQLWKTFFSTFLEKDSIKHPITNPV